MIMDENNNFILSNLRLATNVLRNSCTLFATFLLLVALSSVVSPSAHAQAVTIVEIGNDTVDSTRDQAPRWRRVNFSPLITGTQTIRVEWASAANLRFSLNEASTGTRLATINKGTSPAVWTGTLDGSEDYFLGVWSAAGGVADFIATIEANTAETEILAISTQPADITVIEGDEAIFTVTASGTGTLSYQWFVNNTAIVGATNDTLSLNPTSIFDNASVYRVDITDANTTLSSVTATLTVDVPLAVTTQPADQSVIEGDDAVFSVVATGTGTLNYQWFENNTSIVGATTDTLPISLTSLADNASTFQVVVTDDNGSISSELATLLVAVRLPMTSNTVGQGAVDSESVLAPRFVRVNFDSLATALHTITVSWDSDADLRYNVFDNNDNRLNSSTVRGSNPGVWSGELAVNQRYSVRLWSTDGFTNFTVNVEAAVPIEFTSQPSDLIVTEGDDANLSVEASGSGLLTYQWLANGNPIVGETDSTLTVFATSLFEDGTNYSVEVNNGVNTITSNAATLTVNPTVVLGLFSQEADSTAWMLDGPAPTLDTMATETTDSWGQELLRVGDLLLVGGDFDGIRPSRGAVVTARPFLAALNAVTGQPVSTFQVPLEVNSVVRALALSPSGNQVYVGGDFGLLALNAETGELEFAVSVTEGDSDARVFDIAVTQTQIYIGGDFSKVNNSFRANIARLSLQGDVDLSWSPNVTNGFESPRAAPVQSITVSPDEDAVYVGGNFTLIDGTPVETTVHGANISMLALNASDGLVRPERFEPFVGNNIRALMVHDIAVTEFYVIIAWGGPNFLTFHSLDGARLQQYRGTGDVQALQVVGDHVFVGHHGEFFGFLPNTIPPEAVESLDPEIIVQFRLHSFRIDDPAFLPVQAWRTTGRFGVWGIAAAEDSIWIAGQISRAGTNDRTVDGLARFPALD